MDKKISRMGKLYKELEDMYQLVKLDRKMCAQAHECGNLAGKMIGDAKVELEYASKRGEKPNIPYLNAD
jgi:hypothetical protein